MDAPRLNAIPRPRPHRAATTPGAVPPPSPSFPSSPSPAPVSAWLPSAPCTPLTCVEPVGADAVAVPRAVLRLAALLLVVGAGILLIPAVARIPAALRDRLIRTWCHTIVRSAGVRVRTTGAAPPTGGLLLVANHISWLDIPLLAAVRPARMLAKAEIRRWPVAGALTASSGALFIERDRLRALPETVGRIARSLRDGGAVVVFPESSTWCGRARGRFRGAAFQAALDAGAAVQPVRLHYRYDGGGPSTAPAFVGSDSLLTSVWRVVSVAGLVAEVHVRPTLPPGSAPDRRTLARAAETATTGSARSARSTRAAPAAVRAHAEAAAHP
jgi:1-acyl-sn-glycerol-3-phosphate acyltransferase